MAETDNARELSPRPLMRILSDFAKTHGEIPRTLLKTTLIIARKS